MLRMKSSAFVILLAACNVHCNLTSSYRQDENSRVFRDVAMKMICRAIYPIPNCTNNTRAELKKATDCADIFEMGHNKSGIYEIWPMSRVIESKSFYVYCDMDTNGGGWTVIQRRGDFKNPKNYFYKDWKSYKEGFGNIEEDFWLGNDRIFALTNQKQYSVRFDLKDLEQKRNYSLYDNFWIDDEVNNYTLHISAYSGDAGDSMKFHNGEKFAAFDRDTSALPCAFKRKGAWWYKNCADANLNGLYHKEKNTDLDGILWISWKKESLAWTEIKIRPKNFKTGYSSR